MPDSEIKTVRFKADSALLRELGELLVGKAHIALAELVKNAYDADATRCRVTISENKITVEDNGHGMSKQEFLKHWMTIGTRHKQHIATSRRFKRSVTGSKGVGRLATQFLAHKLEMVTVSDASPGHQLAAEVDWDDAIDTGKLTHAQARYRIERRSRAFPQKKPHGTCVVMRNLKQSWTEDDIRSLGRQLWMIQSPIAHYGTLGSAETDPNNFSVKLNSSLMGIADAFKTQMKKALDNHIAIVSGELTRDGDRTHAHVVVTFSSGKRYSQQFDIAPLVTAAKWEIRVFNLAGRQAGGIKLQEVRSYFEKFGGVLVYDAGFRLPYYGVQQDWLGIEYDHSHRRNRSALLPERLQVRRALNDLPTQGRLFGVVDIDTGKELRFADRQQQETGEYLKIQVTRDRLVANQPYQQLRDAVRWSLDYYATRQRLRTQERVPTVSPNQSPADAAGRVRSLVQEARRSHPDDETLTALEGECRRLSKTIAKEREAEEAARALLAPLASAGMAALALEHETRKEMRRARTLLKRLRRATKDVSDKNVQRLIGEMDAWIKRSEQSRRLFTPLLGQDDRSEVEPLSALGVLSQVVENVRPLLSGVALSLALPKNIILPPATFAEWNSLFQNVLVNAANATLDSVEPKAQCVGGRTGRATWVRVHDNGVGVDLTRAEDLFEPFSRSLDISETRRALGLGGMGLGLTIVRMIADRRNAKASFVEPSPPWTTTFQLSWSTVT